MYDTRRITLIARSAAAPARAWDVSTRAANHLIFVDSVRILKGALDDESQDVQRVIIDGKATEGEFLEMLAALPGDFAGDVLFVGDEHAYLSTTCRAGGRLLYAMTQEDVRFYFEAQRLVAQESIAA